MFCRNQKPEKFICAHVVPSLCPLRAQTWKDQFSPKINFDPDLKMGNVVEYQYLHLFFWMSSGLWVLLLIQLFRHCERSAAISLNKNNGLKIATSLRSSQWRINRGALISYTWKISALLGCIVEIFEFIKRLYLSRETKKWKELVTCLSACKVTPIMR